MGLRAARWAGKVREISVWGGGWAGMS